MADTSVPYTRENWNQDILNQINNLCSNPDPGCDPLPIIPLVEPLHIWTKTDVTEAQDKLLEICPDNEFPELEDLQLWSNETLITPLEDAIDRGWCNCEPEETVFDLGTHLAQEVSSGRYVSESDGAIKSWTACGTMYTRYDSPWHEYPATNDLLYDIYHAQRTIVGQQRYLWFNSNVPVWDVEDEIADLQAELDTLEGELAALETEFEEEGNILTYLEEQSAIICGNDPGSGGCTAAEAAVTVQQAVVDALQADVDAKEAEVGEKQTELSAKEAELPPLEATRLAYREACDAAAQLAWTALKGIAQRYPPDINLIRDYFPAIHESWGDYFEEHRSAITPKWEVAQYNITEGNTAIRTGTFSPGGYPYITSGGTTLVALSNLELACKYSTGETWHDCNCFAWVINPHDCCFGQPGSHECGHSAWTVYWAYVFANPQARNPGCISGGDGSREAPYDYSFILTVTPGPE